jgi:hypothetical protein
VLAAVVQVDLIAFVPPESVKVPLEVFAVLMETRIFSIDCAVNAQLEKAPVYRVHEVVLKTFAGKFAKFVQPFHVSRKPVLPVSVGVPVAALKFNAGKVVSDVQFLQLCVKFTPDEVSINGKDVRPVHPIHVVSNVVPFEVSIKGKLVSLLRFCQDC